MDVTILTSSQHVTANDPEGCDQTWQMTRRAEHAHWKKMELKNHRAVGWLGRRPTELREQGLVTNVLCVPFKKLGDHLHSAEAQDPHAFHHRDGARG